MGNVLQVAGCTCFPACSSRKRDGKLRRLLRQPEKNTYIKKKRLVMEGVEAGGGGWRLPAMVAWRTAGGHELRRLLRRRAPPSPGSGFPLLLLLLIHPPPLPSSAVAPGLLHLLLAGAWRGFLGGFFWGSSNNGASVSPRESSGSGAAPLLVLRFE